MSPYSRFIGKISSKRKPSIIRELLKIMQTASPDMIPLSGGLPNPAMFPFQKAEFTLKDGKRIEMSGETMAGALQYLPTNGYSDLVTKLKEHQISVHNLPIDSFKSGRFELITTNGSQDGLCKSLEMLMNEGDNVCVEDHTFFATMSILDPYHAKYVTVETDSQGMRPDSLWSSLSQNWLPGDPKAPKFIYTNPTGSNPCGTVLPIERKREIYDICSEYNMIIIEDDPYYYMQFGKRREPSFLSIDRDARVLRFDSFSKIMSSGLRLGFVTGPKPLVDKMVLHLQVSVLHASSMSQVLIHELLNEWGTEGFFDHVGQIEEFYEERRDLMHKAAKRHLTGLADWSLPQAGMFLWIKVRGVEDTWRMIMEEGLKQNIMLVPGKVFVPGGKKSPYLRASYSIASVEKFDLAFERLAELIRQEQERQSESTKKTEVFQLKLGS